ncbi:OprO/OprP family phosphate-selective porin [Bradyrhizobium lablabi]|uniref:OprO/OprP family phosphate-selective porin n=1 Tax=Bradyrhizobium lablabi TaxID=722472 RepID=UPI001BA5C4E4|nr:OprO/OprP family phosphate-selective porin [Bradyrhizobium lablabi]MBR0692630.1 porin [Bradyrhizobium lablabi]
MGATRLGAIAVGLAGFLAAAPAYAQSAGGSDAEIALLKQQLRMLEQKLDKLQKQTNTNTEAAAAATAKAKAADAKAARVASAPPLIPVKGPVAPPDVIVKMPDNRPTICTADEQNCIAITSRVHYDVGGYDYRPNSAGTVPQKLDSGQNLRRARIGLIGKFFGDWNYALIYDFGGSSDGFGGAAPGSLPGGGTSGIENAYLSYTGFKPFGGKSALEIGVFDLLYTLDESTASNDILFMERSSATNIATNIAAGDFRSAVGGRWWNDTLWVGAYLTGPTTGAIHSASSVTPPGTSEQVGATARIAGQIISGDGYSLHLGGDAEWLITPPRNFVTNTQSLTLADRPELRIDPTNLISAAIANTSGAQVYSVEAAATYGGFFFQSEYYWYNVERDANTSVPAFGAPSAKFQGGYAQAAYTLTGETRTYNPSTASYNGIRPKNPFELNGSGWGAWEIGGRISQIDLNDQLGTPFGIAAGRQTVYTAGLNWYVNNNIRFMLNYLHGELNKQASSTSTVDVGSKFDAIAMRTQIKF